MRSTKLIVTFVAATVWQVASAVTIIDLSTNNAINPNWVIAPTSPPTETVVTQDPSDSTNYEIKLGVSSFGSAESDLQASAIYGAGTVLNENGGAGYQVLFDTEVYGWDSYNLSVPAPGSVGYWDVFVVNLNQDAFYWNQVNGGSGSIADPVISPDPGGSCIGTAGVGTVSGDACAAGTSLLSGETWAWGALDYANNTFESNSGAYSLTLAGSAGSNYFLSIALDTATTTQADPNYPSFGAFNALSPVPPPSIVPVPAAAWLFGTALIGFIGYGRRRKIN